jgi:RNA polymerase primary sigma factor
MKQLKIAKQFTNRDSNSLDIYLREINSIKLITAEEEVCLAMRIKKGDTVALNKLIKTNLRFVVSVAKQYQNNGLSLQDLINEGNIGLIKAANKFDETKGFKFISYAVWWIRQSMKHAIEEHARMVRIPRNKIELLYKINKATAQLEYELERNPSIEEISVVLNIPDYEIKEMLNNKEKHVSMDAPLNFDEENNMYSSFCNEDSISPDSFLIYNSLQKDIALSLLKLSTREVEVVKLSFGLDGKTPLNLEEIGEILGLGFERVRQIRRTALRRLKCQKNLKNYLS